jgi:hypothetical protein
MNAITWADREVRFDEVSFRTMRELQKMEDRERAMLGLLAASARYVDDGSPVFADIEAIEATPARSMARILTMAEQAFKANEAPEETPDNPT